MKVSRRSCLRHLAAAAAAASLSGVSFSRSLLAQPAAPDLVLTNGRIYTADPAQPWAQAVALSRDRILAVGTNDALSELSRRAAVSIDVGGRVVIPGLNDAATRFTPWPASFSIASTFESSWDEVQAALAGAADETPADMWIVGPLPPSFVGRVDIAADKLDEATGGRKVLLRSADGRTTMFSRTALNALRVSERAPDPRGGWFDRDSGGRITGKAFEYASYGLLGRLSEEATDAEAIEALDVFANDALRLGVTSVQNVSFFPVARLEKIGRHTEVPIRVRVIRFPLTTSNGWDVPYGVDVPSVHRERPMVKISGTVIPASERFTQSEQASLIRDTLTRNDQPIFCFRNAEALWTGLDALKAEMSAEEWRRLRPRVEFLVDFPSDSAAELEKRGVLVGWQPRTGNLAAIARYAQEGAVAFGSGDWPAPFDVIARATESSPPGMTREAAVGIHTFGSAYAENAETEKGKLIEGMYADLAVLSEDLFRASASTVRATESVLTVVGGRVAYDAGVLGRGRVVRGRRAGNT